MEIWDIGITSSLTKMEVTSEHIVPVMPDVVMMLMQQLCCHYQW